MSWWLALVVACVTPWDDDGEPDPADYDAACAVDADCEAVEDQGFCGACSGWGALSVDGAEVFLDDQARYADRHRCQGVILIGCLPIGDAPAVTCGGGACAVVP